MAQAQDPEFESHRVHLFAIAYAEKDRPQAMDDYRLRFQNHGHRLISLQVNRRH